MVESETSTSPDGADLSSLVKEIVKDMDGDELLSKPDMYDDSKEERWFNIEITLERECEGGEDTSSVLSTASLRKPWSEFQRLHYLLLTDEFGCDEAVKEQLPVLPTGPPGVAHGSTSGNDDAISNEGGHNGGGVNTCSSGGGSTSIAEMAQGLDAYFRALLAVPAVVQSQVFSGFLEEESRAHLRTDKDVGKEDDRSGSSAGIKASGCSSWGSGVDEGARKSPETAIDFLLQPFEYRKAYLPRRAEHSDSIDVLRGESVVWKFEVMDHLDIDFSVTFRPHPVALFSCPPIPELGEDHDQTAPETDRVVHQTPEERLPSPGPKDGRGGSSITTANVNADGCGSSEDKGKSSSRWWGRGGSTGCKKAVAAPSVDESGGRCGREEDGGEVEAPKDQIVHLPTRYSTGGGDPVQGSFSCPAAGTCILRWDNSFSRLRGKRLCYVFESVTIQTMRAAIEAAGAIDHKRRATRSSAAQTILDSGHGVVKVSVTAVGAEHDFDADREERQAEDGGSGGVRNHNGVGLGRGGGGSGSRVSLSKDRASIGSGMAFYGSHYKFGRVRRVVADLLRDLGGMVDTAKGGARCGDHFGADTGGSSDGGNYGNVDAKAVEKLVTQLEMLEDELASVSAARAQSESQAKVLLATLQKANTRADRLERSLEQERENLSTTRENLVETEASRDEAAAAAELANVRLQTSEEQLLRSRREHDLLQAERSVWQVARSGIQEELAKVVAELELERHRHEDTSSALAKSRESRAHAEAEVSRLSRRLEEERGGAGGARAALAAEREAARLAREEAEDARTAVADLDAAVAELGAQKRVLVAGLRTRERVLGDRCAGAEARAEEAAMMRRAAETRVRELEEEAERRETALADAEVRVQRLRAEKKVLLAEVRRGAGAGLAAAGVDGSEAAERGGGGIGGSTGGAGSEGMARGRAAGGVGGNFGSRSSFSPRSPAESVQDSKATLKQLSKQLVVLRERQLHLREDLRADPSNSSALRLEGDVDRAVQNLEARIRRLLTVVSGGDGGDEDDPPAGLSPPAGSMRRKSNPSLMENQRPSAAPAPAETTVERAAATGSSIDVAEEDAEVQTYSV